MVDKGLVPGVAKYNLAILSVCPLIINIIQYSLVEAFSAGIFLLLLFDSFFWVGGDFIET